MGKDVVAANVELVCRPEVLRLGLERLLSQAEGLAVTAHADIPAEPPAAGVTVLCERGLGDLVSAVERARERECGEVVVVLAEPDVHAMLDCVAAGAAGLVLESDAAPGLIAAVRAALQGECYLGPSLLGLLLAYHRAERATPGSEDRVLLRLLAGGRATDEIATLLGVAPKTLRNRSSLLYRRLGVRSRAGAIEAAERRGLLD